MTRRVSAGPPPMKNRKREICTSGSVRDEAGQPPHLLGRRKFLHLAAGAAALPAVSRIARAQTYPTRPVHIIVGFAPGSASDIIARLIGQRLSERLGQPFVVENRGGAGGTLGAEAVVRAPPDGYTLLLCGSPDAFNATIYDKLSFNFTRDIAPVAGISRGPLVLVVHPSFPAKTVPAFIVYAKANPGKINFGSAGVGTVAAVGRRAVQGHGGRRFGARAISWPRARDHRPDRRTGTGDILHDAAGDRAGPSREAARAGSDLCHALSGACRTCRPLGIFCQATRQP